METYIDDVFSICEKLGIDKVIILGTSYGAISALRLASKYPELVDRLILVAGAYSHVFRNLAMRNVQERGSLQQVKWVKSLLEGSIKDKELGDFLADMGSLYSYRVGQGEKVPSSPLSFNTSVCMHGWKSYLKDFDFTQDLAQIKCPTLILAGRLDWVCDVTQSIEMSQKIANNELHIFERASHFLTVDVPQEYIEKITTFLTFNH